MSRIVDFFIVGTLKSGSTSLDKYLKQHPEIYMSPVKDKPYYGRDLYPYLTKSEHKKLYDNLDKDLIIGETNTWYIYSKSAAREIKKDSPKAKIVILIRNPIDFLQSYHSEMCFGLLEDEKDFEKALAREIQRKASFKKDSRDYWGRKYLYYSDVAKFSEQIKRYFDVFGKENVKVIIFDDFVKNINKVYTDLLSFIGVKDTAFLPEFNKYNANKEIRSTFFQRLMTMPPRQLKSLYMVVPFRLRYLLLMFLFKINSRNKSRKPLSSELRGRLIKKYKPEVKKLEKLLNIKLPTWYT